MAHDIDASMHKMMVDTIFGFFMAHDMDASMHKMMVDTILPVRYDNCLAGINQIGQ